MPTLTPPPPTTTPLLSDPQMTALKLSRPWGGWFRNLYNLLQPGKTEDVTVSGTTFHFVNGVYTGKSP